MVRGMWLALCKGFSEVDAFHPFGYGRKQVQFPKKKSVFSRILDEKCSNLDCTCYGTGIVDLLAVVNCKNYGGFVFIHVLYVLMNIIAKLITVT
jgi:hypothetical protein